MIVLGYIGDPKTSSFGFRLIRWAQRNFSAPAREVTHTEIMLAGTPGAATIASSSLTDTQGDGKGGVRTKHNVALKSANWRAMYVPDTAKYNTARSARWFAEHDGFPYDRRGAAGSVGQALVQQEEDEFFCSEACGASMSMADAHMLCPAALWNILPLIGGVDVTDLFFGDGFRPEWVAA